MFDSHTGDGEYARHPGQRERIWSALREHISTANVVGVLFALCALLLLLLLPDTHHIDIRLPLYLIVVVWVLVRPRIALYLLPFAIPWGSLDNPDGSFSTHGYDADLLVGLLALSWLLGMTLRTFAVREERIFGPLDREPWQLPRMLLVSTLLLLASMVISVKATTSISTSLKEILKWSELLILLLIGTPYIRTRRQVWTLVVVICLAATSQACLGYVQNFFALGPSSFVRDGSQRVYGTFNQPNPFAGYINIALTITIALTLLGHGVKVRYLAGLATLFLAGVEFFTLSKGGWIALGAAVLLITLVGIPRLRPVIGVCCFALLAAIGGFVLGILPMDWIEPILIKLGFVDINFVRPNDYNFANAERLAHWVAGLEMFRDHPLIGVGIGNYANVYPHYTQGVFTIPLGHAHNFYINMAAETGILGLLTFLLFLTAVFLVGGRACRRLIQRAQEGRAALVRSLPAQSAVEQASNLQRLGILVNDRALAIGLLAALVAVCVHNLVDNVYVHGMTALFALVILLLIRLPETQKQALQQT